MKIPITRWTVVLTTNEFTYELFRDSGTVDLLKTPTYFTTLSVKNPFGETQQNIIVYCEGGVAATKTVFLLDAVK